MNQVPFRDQRRIDVCHLKYLNFKKKDVKNQGKGFKEKKEAKRVMTTIGHQCQLLRKLKVSSLENYLDKHGISWSTLKKNKVDVVAAHIARSIVNSDAMNNEEHDVEDEESDEEYRDDAVLEEIGGDSDKIKQQILHNKVKKMKMTARVTMTERTTIVVMTTTTKTMAAMTTTAVAVLAMMSMKVTIVITAKKCK